MPKNALFLLNNRKNRRTLEAPPPDPIAAGGKFAPQTPLISPLITNSWLRAWTRYCLKSNLHNFILGAVHKKSVRIQGERICPVRTFRRQGEEFFRCGRPHFLVQKLWIFRNIVCPHGQEGGLSQCGHL